VAARIFVVDPMRRASRTLRAVFIANLDSVNAAIRAIVLRMTVFAGVSLGTFVLYLTVGELSGMIKGTPLELVPGGVIAVLLLKAAFILTSGHGIALRVLAFVFRGFSVPSLGRSAVAGIVCSTALEMAYLSDSWLSDLSVRGVVRLGFSMVISFLICAIRARRRDEELAPTQISTAAVAIEPG
jgi:hypothetical protein